MLSYYNILLQHVVVDDDNDDRTPPYLNPIFMLAMNTCASWYYYECNSH